LLTNGQIDETLLELILAPRSAALRRSPANFDDETLGQVNAETERQINQWADALDAAQDHSTQEALAFVQLIYGLLRNPLRNLLVPLDSGIIGEQACV
jgi:hypothetical protein